MSNAFVQVRVLAAEDARVAVGTRERRLTARDQRLAPQSGRTHANEEPSCGGSVPQYTPPRLVDSSRRMTCRQSDSVGHAIAPARMSGNGDFVADDAGGWLRKPDLRAQTAAWGIARLWRATPGAWPQLVRHAFEFQVADVGPPVELEHVHRSGESGSPGAVGSTSASSRAATSGSASSPAYVLRPAGAPIARHG